MGEWSKKVGEAGEALVGEFLSLVGWGTAKRGISIPCVKADNHVIAEHPRTTHGIDYLLAHRSPLVDDLGQHIVVSVKYSAEPYPASPSATFKKHFVDLAFTLECFKNSQARQDNAQGLRGVRKVQDVGVLFWLNNDKRGDGDVIARLPRVNLPDGLSYDLIYVVDNRRAQFVFDSVRYAMQLGKDSDVRISYHETGKNLNPLQKTHCGTFLPVEYINSSVLPFRILEKASHQQALFLSTLERFSESGLKRLLGLAQQLSQGWGTKVIVAFPDYDPLIHSNMVQGAKGCFSDEGFIGRLEIHCYDSDFRTLNH
jgi:hypothetical protein